MSLATQLLEGYNGTFTGDNSPVTNPSEFLQEACIAFVTECYDAYQIFKTADIIGSAKVVTESVDPQSVYESVVSDFGKAIVNTFTSFIKKLDSWRKAIATAIKKKIQAAKDSSMTKAITKLLDGHDDDEKINGFTYPAVAFDVETGLAATEQYVDALNNEYYKCTEALFSITSGEVSADKHDATAKAFGLDKVKKNLKDSLKCDPDSVLEKVASSFGKPTSSDTTYTVGCIRGIMASTDEYAKAADNQLTEVDALMTILKEFEKKFTDSQADDGTPISGDVLGAISASITYIVNLEISSLKTSLDRVGAAIDQNRGILTSVKSVLKGSQWGAVTEGDDPVDMSDDGESDPPEPDNTDDDGDPVTEGTNIDMIKQYLNKCKPLIKQMKETDKKFSTATSKSDFVAAKKQYQDIQKTLEKLADDISSIPDSDKSALYGTVAALASDVLIGFDTFVSNFWVNKTMRSYDDYVAAGQKTNGTRNPNKRGIVAKINACINRCKRQITACDEKAKAVTESASIFEQAQQYL